MLGHRRFLIAAAVGALLPLWHRADGPSVAPRTPWPSELAGRPLERLPTSELDREFEQSAPIEVARFAWGQAHVVVRRTPVATPRLHSLRECFRGLGRQVRPLADVQAPAGHAAAAFEVEQRGGPLRVREWIVDGAGRVETDFPRAYWRSQRGTLEAPLRAFAVVER